MDDIGEEIRRLQSELDEQVSCIGCRVFGMGCERWECVERWHGLMMCGG